MALLGAATLALAASAGGGVGQVRAAPSHCAAGERVLYTCAFPRGLGSLCGTGTALHYRFGPRGTPQIDLASSPDWSNVHTGEVHGQGNGRQSHVRLSRGGFHYTVFAGVDGDLADRPGRRYSGIAVQKGEHGEEDVATMACAGRAVMHLDDSLLTRRARPEEDDGPFDMWF